MPNLASTSSWSAKVNAYATQVPALTDARTHTHTHTHTHTTVRTIDTYTENTHVCCQNTQAQTLKHSGDKTCSGAR